MSLNLLSITFDGRLTQTTGGRQYSGAQQRQREYAQLLNDYVILTPRIDKSTPPSVRLSPNLQIYPTRSRGKINFIVEAYQLGLELAKFHHFNCITAANTQATGIVGYLLKRRLDLPLNIHLMADVIDNPYYLAERRRNPLYNRLSKWLIRQSDTVRVSTKWEKQRLATYPDFPEIWHVPFYIDPELFLARPSGDLRKQFLGDDFDFIVLSVGRLSTQKDPLTLIDAAALVIEKHPRTLFLLAGEGPMRESIENKIELLGIGFNVMLLGAVPYEKMPELHQTADLFAIASLYEGTCMALHEAAVSKKPLVATRFAGAKDLILNGKNGFRVPIGDSREMANRISTLLSDADLRHEMGKAAKARSIVRNKKLKILNKYIEMWQATADKMIA